MVLLTHVLRPEYAPRDARPQDAETIVPNTPTCDLREAFTPTAALSIERWTQKRFGAVQVSRNLSLHCHRWGAQPYW